MIVTLSRQNGYMKLDEIWNKNNSYPGQTYRLICMPENASESAGRH